MKKGLVTFLLVLIASSSFVVPVMATDTATTQKASTATYQEIAPLTEMTRMYFRNHYGQIQFRVWSITNGRWLTQWTNVNAQI